MRELIIKSTGLPLQLDEASRITFNKRNALWHRSVFPAEYSLPLKVVLNPENRVALGFIDSIDSYNEIPDKIDITYQHLGVVYPAFLKVIQFTEDVMEASLIIGKSLEMDLLKVRNCNDLELGNIELSEYIPEVTIRLGMGRQDGDTIVNVFVQFNGLKYERDFQIPWIFNHASMNDAVTSICDEINADPRNTFVDATPILSNILFDPPNGTFTNVRKLFYKANKTQFFVMGPSINLKCRGAHQKYWIDLENLDRGYVFDGSNTLLDNVDDAERNIWVCFKQIDDTNLSVEKWVTEHSSDSLKLAYDVVASGYNTFNLAFPLVNNYKYPNDDERTDWFNLFNRLKDYDDELFDLMLNNNEFVSVLYGKWRTSIVPMIRVAIALKKIYDLFGFEFKSALFESDDFKDLILYSNKSCGKILKCWDFDVINYLSSGDPYLNNSAELYTPIPSEICDVHGSYIEYSATLPSYTVSDFLLSIMEVFNLVVDFDYMKNEVLIEPASSIWSKTEIREFVFEKNTILKKFDQRIDEIAFTIVGDDEQQEFLSDYQLPYVINPEVFNKNKIEFLAGISKEGIYKNWRLPIIDIPYTSPTPIYLFFYKKWQNSLDGKNYLQASVLDKAADDTVNGNYTLSLHGYKGIYNTFHKDYVDIVNKAKVLKVKGVMAISDLMSMRPNTFFKNNGQLFSWDNREYKMINDGEAEVVMDLIRVILPYTPAVVLPES